MWHDIAMSSLSLTPMPKETSSSQYGLERCVCSFPCYLLYNVKNKFQDFSNPELYYNAQCEVHPHLPLTGNWVLCLTPATWNRPSVILALPFTQPAHLNPVAYPPLSQPRTCWIFAYTRCFFVLWASWSSFWIALTADLLVSSSAIHFLHFSQHDFIKC